MMIFGALTAVVVVFTQIFLYQAPPTVDSGVKTEKSADNSSGEQVLIATPFDSVLSSFHAGINHEPVFLFEILFDGHDSNGWAAEVPVSLGKYFLTLFHTIISPNAP